MLRGGAFLIRAASWPSTSTLPPARPQEKAWNAYYAHLLARLCGAGKSHKMTLQVRAECPPCSRWERGLGGAQVCSKAGGAAALPSVQMKVNRLSLVEVSTLGL